MDLVLPAADDLHVHLRQGALMCAVVPLVHGGGCRRVYVMPNLTPPIATAEQAVRYREELQRLEPRVAFLMTLYLNAALTPADIAAARAAGVVGVKSYPRGVTTNSEGGIESYEGYYPVFAAMEQHGLVLNLHGEVPSSATVSVLDAEAAFLPHLEKLHRTFPRLRIVLEHATTAAAIDMVKRLGDTVAATITVHHLDLIVDDWAGKAVNFCKPVAKTPADREALRAVVREGNPKFFFGSDSAPHARRLKQNEAGAPAGVFTTPYVLPYLAQIFEDLGCLDKLRGFVAEYGARFYGLAPQTETVRLVRREQTVPAEIPFGDDADTSPDAARGTVVPFWAGRTLRWSLEA